MQPTPPHHPTYNIRLSIKQLRSIIEFVFPHQEVLRTEQLATGKSFNNRIYFVYLNGNLGNVSKEYVLKLSGHYFGARKIQNELGALSLLKKYCPDIPVPRVVAWSEDGAAIHTIGGRKQTLSDAVKSCNGWILTTRIAGRPLTEDDLDGPNGDALLGQLASHLAQWRTLIPGPRHIGNLRFYEHSENDDSAIIYRQLQDDAPVFTVSGLILTHKYQTSPLPNILAYLKYQLQDQYDHLATALELAPLKILIAEPVARFIPLVDRLSIFNVDNLTRCENEPNLASGQPCSNSNNNNSIVFSHMDFAPRNILVAEHSTTSDQAEERSARNLVISGILDFEFSAFLPYPEEFLNSIVHQPNDWPDRHYTTLLTHLATLGVSTPALEEASSLDNDNDDESDDVNMPRKEASVLEYSNFRTLGVLEKLIANVAPWWMTSYWAGEHSEIEVYNECQKIAKEVLNAIAELERGLTS